MHKLAGAFKYGHSRTQTLRQMLAVAVAVAVVVAVAVTLVVTAGARAGTAMGARIPMLVPMTKQATTTTAQRDRCIASHSSGCSRWHSLEVSRSRLRATAFVDQKAEDRRCCTDQGHGQGRAVVQVQVQVQVQTPLLALG